MHPPVYLEATERSQDLLTVKWTLRSAGYPIASTWHDESLPAPLAARAVSAAQSIAEILPFGALIIVRERGRAVPMELAFLLGVAATRGVRVMWIGEPDAVLAQVKNVQYFATPEDFRKRIADPAEEWPAELTLAA